MNDIRSITEWAAGEGTSRVERAIVDDRTLVECSGLFDAAWYLRANTDIAACGLEPLGHFLAAGWREGRKPNAYFDPHFYLRQNAELTRTGINPLVDYIRRGEAAGRSPCEWFDLFWYRSKHRIEPGETVLGHFLARRFDGSVSPLPEFDPAYYLTTYTDIAAARVDPFEHFLDWGYKEPRNPSADFDTRFYVQRHLRGETARNPLLHYRQFRDVTNLPTKPPAQERAVFEEVRRFGRAGPAFERFTPLPRGAPRRAKVLATYLPQFHAIPENDSWWGEGFTEWQAIGRGMPRFLDHYQPRMPGALGHYSLEDSNTMRQQADMARDSGVAGFVMYFYWFNGKRLLERPVELFLADAGNDFPFCLMWANENWTRRWDGSDNEVLISQDYRASDDAALIDCYARHFRDKRYIRIDGRPLLMIYRPRLIPDTRATVERWRKLFAMRHGEQPLLVMAQSFGDIDPRPHGLDGAIEFPPHKLVSGLNQINRALTHLDINAHGQVFAYDDVVAASLAEPAPAFPLIKTAAPSWDNDARRQGNGLTLHGSTPERYQAWLEALVERAVEHPFFGERIVCVNAWNEWAEGAYLEPDVHFGAAYANATARAVTGLPQAAESGRVLLVGHDAFPAGAQMLLLHLGAALRRRCGVQVEFVLLDGGALQVEYEQVAPTTIASGATCGAVIADAASRGFATAIVNSSAAARAGLLAAKAGISVTMLVHELPGILRQRKLIDDATACAAIAHRVILPAPSVAAAFASVVPVESARLRVVPQGCYRPVTLDLCAREALRAMLGVDARTRVVIGAGTGDMRKGFDVFLQSWHVARASGGDVAFVWLGRIDEDLSAALGPELDDAVATGRFHAPGFTPNIVGWMNAADVFALTSREDPLPSVVLEAFSAGLPVVAFSGGGGAPDLIARLGAGTCVPMGNAAAMAEALLGVELTHDRSAMANTVAREFYFPTYAARVLAEALPDLPSVSVAVPSCDYERYMAGRLGSIFAQTLPVAEVLVFDDASIDSSVAIASDAAADWKREIGIVVRTVRSGSPFGQWRAAAERARGTWLWIAEADDEAEPGFLAAVAQAVRGRDDIVMAATDSRSIDATGGPIWPSYAQYYADSGAPELARDLVLPARDFACRFLSQRNLLLNVSAVVWRRTALLAALDRCEAELPNWRLAGDWRVYMELLAEEQGSVAWIAAPLNVHRRHAASVTATTLARAHTREIARMHALLRARFALGPEAVALQAEYRAHVHRQRNASLIEG